MKKVYTKPQIIFDSFELSQNIAAGCQYISNHAWQMCIVENVMGDTLFSEVLNCGITSDPTSIGICYDVPSADTMVFSS